MAGFEELEKTVSGLGLSPETLFNMLALHLATQNLEKVSGNEKEINYFIRFETDESTGKIDAKLYTVAFSEMQDKEGNFYPCITRVLKSDSLKEKVLKCVQAYKDEKYEDIISILAGESLDINSIIANIKSAGING